MTFSLSQLILTVLLNVFFLVYLEMGVKGILLGTLLANSLLGSIMIGLILKNVGVGFSPDLYLKMIRYGLPLIPSSIATYLMIASDRYFVKEFVSLRHTGLYSLGYKLGSVSHNFVTSPFIQIWFPRRFELFNQENSEEMFARIFTYFTAVLTFGALGISLLARDVLQIMTTEAFWPAANVVPLIALAHVIHAFFYHFTIGISYKKKTIYYVYINITAGVVNLILNYFLIRRFGMWGAAYATILTYTCRTGLVYYFSSRLYPIVFEKVRILKILLAAAAVYVLGRYLEQSSLGLDILVKLFVLGGFPLLLLGAKFFREDELTAVKGYARRLKARFFGNRTPDRDATDGDNRK